MSIEMNARTAPGPLSRLDDLPALERRVVVCARLWCEGPAGQATVERDWGPCGGVDLATQALDRLDELLGLCFAHGRRPLQIDGVRAEGVSGDECVLGRFVALAAEGKREEAILIATLLVRADLALGLARTAEALGLLLLRERYPRAPAWTQ